MSNPPVETLTAVEALVEANETITALWERLTLADPEAVELLKTLESQKSGLVEKAKTELREAGPGSVKLGSYNFRVATGGVKKVFDLEDILEEADDRGHMKELLRCGVLTYTVNETQMERLDPELRAIYGNMYTTQVGTLRVTIPTALQ